MQCSDIHDARCIFRTELLRFCIHVANKGRRKNGPVLDSIRPKKRKRVNLKLRMSLRTPLNRYIARDKARKQNGAYRGSEYP